jgi:hypothetical protein
MTQEEAKNEGYIKIIDYHRTYDFLQYNIAIIDHAAAEIKPSKDMFINKTVLISNFAFIMRAMLYYTILVTLLLEPGITIFMLLLVELTYMILIVWNFFKLKYLVSIHLFLSKII